MVENNQKNRTNLKLVGKIIGGLAVGIPFISTSALALPRVPNPGTNPCPKIYYEEPYESKLIVPQSCPPNAATRGLLRTGNAPEQQTLVVPSQTRVEPVQPPLPENRAMAIATIQPIAGKVSVMLKNETNARISYQAVTQTETRILPGGEEVVLQNLPTPITITMVREDGGLLKVMPMSADQGGMLTVSLDEQTTPDNNQGVLRIQEDGQVFLN